MLKIGILLFISGLCNSHILNTQDPMCKAGPPVDAFPDLCCTFPDLFPDEVVEQCEKTYGVNTTRKNSDDYDVLEDLCVVECVFNQTGLNSEGQLNKDNIINYLKSQTNNDSDWSNLVKPVMDHCFATLTEVNINMYVNDTMEHLKAKGITNAQICHPINGYVLDCIYFELFLNCPNKKYSSSESCIKLMNYAKICDDW